MHQCSEEAKKILFVAKLNFNERMGDKSTIATIQVRFPDGSTDKQNFGAEDSVKTIFEWIATHKKKPNEEFSLINSYPRRVFDESNWEETLKQAGFRFNHSRIFPF